LSNKAWQSETKDETLNWSATYIKFPDMSVEEHIKAGELDEALGCAQEAVRKTPADARPRILLFQLFSVLGQWERALTQLNVVRDMDPECMVLAEIFRPVLQCEALREEIFAGKRSPLIFGEPAEWIGLLVQANALLAQNQAAAALELRDKAFEAAPATTGKINDQSFEWIADGDSRFGPMVEAIIDGKYYWVPFFRIASLTTASPEDLRDLVWTATQFVWANGGEAPGFIPTRYPGTEKATDNSLRLARKTEWIDQGNELFFGVGQRMFATDQAEVALTEVRRIEFTQS
jgi:type VI secretion system protein ImpE